MDEAPCSQNARNELRMQVANKYGDFREKGTLALMYPHHAALLQHSHFGVQSEVLIAVIATFGS